MNYDYAVHTLRQEAFKIGAKVLELEAERKGLDNADDITKLANDIIFGELMADVHHADTENFLELLKAIEVLKNEPTTNPQ